MSRDFNQFRFAGLDYKTADKNHWTMRRFAEDGSKCVVKVAPEQIFETKYGHGLILDRGHVAYLRDWSILAGEFGSVLVLLDRDHFVAKRFGSRAEYAEDLENCKYEAWLEAARQQAEADTERVLVKRF